MNAIHVNLEKIPPSVNHCYYERVIGTGKRKFVQKGYKKEAKDYFEYVKLNFLAAPKCPEGRLYLILKMRFGDKRARDLDNYLKVMLDALQFYIGNDSRFDRITIERLNPPGKEEVFIELGGIPGLSPCETSLHI